MRLKQLPEYHVIRSSVTWWDNTKTHFIEQDTEHYRFNSQFILVLDIGKELDWFNDRWENHKAQLGTLEVDGLRFSDAQARDGFFDSESHFEVHCQCFRIEIANERLFKMLWEL